MLENPGELTRLEDVAVVDFVSDVNDAAVAAAVSDAGFDPYEKKMLSLTALEKLMGRKNFQNLLSDLVVRTEGKPVLVPVSDRREEITVAAADFAAIDKEEKTNE